MTAFPRILSIAGSDSGGGAGIQADIKTITMLGGYTMTAVTALTAQDSRGVAAIHAAPVDLVIRQIEMAIGDFGVDAIKTGMLGDRALIVAVADCLRRLAPGVPLVVDPVMVAKGGARLLPESAERALVEELFPLATVVTPNIPEAEALTGRSIDSLDAMQEAAHALIEAGAAAILLKGGHLAGPQVIDVLATASLHSIAGQPPPRMLRDRSESYISQRIDTPHTHGTGCTLASAVATLLGHGLDLYEAVPLARGYVHRAIAMAPGYGHGQGPLNHLIVPEKVKQLALREDLR